MSDKKTAIRKPCARGCAGQYQPGLTMLDSLHTLNYNEPQSIVIIHGVVVAEAHIHTTTAAAATVMVAAAVHTTTAHAQNRHTSANRKCAIRCPTMNMCDK